MIAASHSLKCEPAAARDARRWVRAALEPQLPASDQCAELVEDIVLCVSELVTDAYRCGCARMRLRCTIGVRCIRLRVADDAGGQPEGGLLPTPWQGQGLGMRLVRTLAQRCTVTADPHGPGKHVWLEFRRPGSDPKPR